MGKYDTETVGRSCFRVSDLSTTLHSDFEYLMNHTSLFRGEKGLSLMFSGHDINSRGKYDRDMAKGMWQQWYETACEQTKTNANGNTCSICSSAATSQAIRDAPRDWCLENLATKTIEEDIVNGGTSSSSKSPELCMACQRAPYGVFVVWTALDYYRDPWTDGGLIFCLSSHDRYKTTDSGTTSNNTNHASPWTAYPRILLSKSRNWFFAKDLKPGDTLIFNIK
ncbi:hypothetical protein RFI_16408, partial [Reticulomyxa filosa]